jgi:hypothetical protein
MNDEPFAFIQALFHVVLFFVIHGVVRRRRTNTDRKETRVQNRNSSLSQSAALNNHNCKRIIQPKGDPMKPVLRYQSQLLFRKSYKPNRVIRIRPVKKVALMVRPARAGPQKKLYEYATD